MSIIMTADNNKQDTGSRNIVSTVFEYMYLFISAYGLYYALNLVLFVFSQEDGTGGFVTGLIALPLIPWLLLSVAVNPILILRNIKRVRSFPAGMAPLSSG